MMNKKQRKPLKRGEIWLAEFPPTKEDRKSTRPCLVISNDIQNEYGKWVVVATMTTKDIEVVEPFEVFVKNIPKIGLDCPSKLKFNYPCTVDRARLKEPLGKVSPEIMKKAKVAWQIAFDTEEW